MQGTNFSEISGHISAMTEHIAGAGADVSEKVIRLTVRRPEYPDLTLIDLPGVVV